MNFRDPSVSPNQCLECCGYKWAIMCLDLTWVPGNRTQVPMLSKHPLYTKWAKFPLGGQFIRGLFSDGCHFLFCWTSPLETLENLLIYYEYIFIFGELRKLNHYIHPPLLTSSQIHLFSFPPQLCVLFSCIKVSLYCPNILGCVTFHWNIVKLSK